MDNLPPLNALRAFDVAGRHLNFRAAAEEINVTQGAIAQQVRLLEAHLGRTLFERLSRGLAFTPFGRIYHRSISGAFSEMRAATAVLKPEHDTVVASVTPTFASKWLLPNLPDFSADHPEIEMKVLATEKISSFHADNIDLAIRQGSPPNLATLEVVCLFRQEIIAVCSSDLIEDEKPPLSANCLAKLPKLHDAHELWPIFLKSLNIHDVDRGGMHFSQTALAIDAALSGQGCALVSRFLVARELENGTLIEVSDQPMFGEQDFYLIGNNSAKRSVPAEAAFRWFVSKSIKHQL